MLVKLHALRCSLQLLQNGFKGLNDLEKARLLVFVLDARLDLSDLEEQ